MQIEQWLESCDDGQIITIDRLQKQIKGRRPTGNELHTVMEALQQMGILRKDDNSQKLDLNQLKGTKGYRQGVRDGFTLQSVRHPKIQLCAVLPPDLPLPLTQLLLAETVELRSVLTEMIATATERIILASPFWDAPTAGEITGLLERRIDAGVRVDLLGRFSSGEDSGSRVLWRRLANRSSSRIFDWYEIGDEGQKRAQTFHFKAAAIDGGLRAWLGTANFTTANLRSRMELGFVVSDRQAQALFRVLDLVLGLARQIN